MGAQNRSTRTIETQLESLPFVLYYLNSTYSFHFYCVFIKSLRKGAFLVRLLFYRQVVQENMTKAWDVTKNKLCHRRFDNNLQIIFQTNIHENGTKQIFLIVVLVVDVFFLFIYLLTLFNVDYKTLAACALIKIDYPYPLP